MSTSTEREAWPGSIAAVTLFPEDLEASKRFSQEVFDLAVELENHDSALFRFGETLVNPLAVSGAPELIEPATGRAHLGDRSLARGV